MIQKDIIIIGAGPAGLAAAIEAKKNGMEDVLVIEREAVPGGILNQCIHDGFGLIKFNEALTGPEYAGRYVEEAKKLNVEIMTKAMVLDLNSKREVTVVSPSGLQVYSAGAVILAMGCRERTRGAISIPGTRPAGVFTAGVAQHLVNLKNIMIGKKVVILGSGDIGLIMARRLTLEGAEVIAVLEKLPYSSGLPRNITQCLEDYDIPLLLSHTVINIEGKERVKSVTTAKVDDRGEVIRGTTRKIECDTLILSVGLIPENELSLNAEVILDEVTSGASVDEDLQTNIPGIFACGNVLQVHDLVDHVSSEGERAAKAAVNFVRGTRGDHTQAVSVKSGDKVRYILPQRISGKKDVIFSMRVTEPLRDKKVIFRCGLQKIKSFSMKNLNPAEMIRLKLKAQELEGLQELEVCIGE
ncbi:MAG: NAD(P)/FAD-dependent oxidoreductase [Clostridia bacterium]|nr:NAD(P)/FAD-dependent oxidoreductase [Clostridia bacterium]